MRIFVSPASLASGQDSCIFTRALLRARLVWLMMLLGAAAPIFAATPVALVASNSVWKYLDDGSNQGAAWTGLGFDDHTWAFGPAQLGYGDGDEATVVGFGPDENNKYITTYFRQKFVVEDPSLLPSNLTLRLQRDDGAVVYLNGVEVYRDNMPAGLVDYLTLASTFVADQDEVTFFPATLNSSSLVAGDNVIAVEIHQSTADSSDISFNLQLEYGPVAPPTITTPPAGQSVACGSDVSFSVAATSDTALRYQWLRNGTPIIGATDSMLNLAAVGLAQGGDFSVTVRNIGGSVTSDAVALAVTDTIAPLITCPGDQSVECAGPAGTIVTFSASASDNCDASVAANCVPASGSAFALGSTLVTCTATDVSGNSSSCSFTVTVRDTVPPLISCPADRTVECTGPAGTSVSFSVSATDTCDPAPSVVCVPPSGAVFALGAHPVNCTATDASGNSSMCGFTVTVRDTTAPAIVCPADINALCRGTNQVRVFYRVSASDACDPSPTVVCIPPSGTDFAAGAHTVTCTAGDASGNVSSCAFTVNVSDPMLPLFTLVPTNAVWKYLDNGSDQGTAWREWSFDDHTWASGPARIGYGDDGEVTVVSFGPDENNKYITTYFRHAFNITDPASVPGLLMRLIRDDGAVVYLNGTEVYRSNLPDGPVNYLTQAPRFVADGEEYQFFESCLDPSLLVPGNNVLAVEIHQYDGLSSDISLELELDVLGAHPPAITTPPQSQTVACASDVTFSVVATGTGPLAYQWRRDGTPIIDATSATLNLTAVGLTAAGNYSVDVTNPYGTASATAALTVQDTVAPVVVCPADKVVEGTSPSGAMVSFTASATDNCDATVSVICTPASGSVFALGNTTVMCSATDVSGNSGSCSFTVTVRDTTAPVVTCPGDQTVECLSPAGTAVDFLATATDVCDPNPSIVCVPPSGSIFVLGAHTVMCTAMDAGGNSSSCSFTVTVRDTTAPVITCPADLAVECTGPSGATATYAATATDACDPNPSIVCVPASGSTFTLGAHTVICTATDASGNSSSCSFTVTAEDHVSAVLTIVVQDTSVIITWPATCTSYQLEETTDLVPPVTWNAVSDPPVLDGTSYKVTLPLGSDNHFFQLRKL